MRSLAGLSRPPAAEVAMEPGDARNDEDIDEDLCDVDGEQPLAPPVALVEGMVRRCDPRGSDLRLDSGEAMRPDLWPRRPIPVGRWTWRTVA
eukprot:13389556-Alexandrium_andersonii.AAC.1